MLLKVIVYSYLNNIYSSRKIAQALKESVYFMWLSGMQMPDHNTINRFRTDRLSKVIKEVFTQIVHLLHSSGHVSLQEVYLDGTKIEANANKYSFVWGNSIKYQENRIAGQLEELWDYARKVTKEEALMPNSPEFTPISSESVNKTIAGINYALKDKQVDKQIRKKLTYAEKHWSDLFDKYKGQKEILGDRSSYSKTDTDASFMYMKDGGRQRQDLKAGYNVQISTNNQVILNYGIYSTASDTVTLKSMVEDYHRQYHSLPTRLIADAGYGSLENYSYLEHSGIEAVVKYSGYEKQKKHHQKHNPYSAEQMHYNDQEDYYECPEGRQLKRAGQKERISTNGFRSIRTSYESVDCTGCPLAKDCIKSGKKKTITVSHEVQRLRKKAKQVLDSEEGKVLSRRRKADVEPVFANIKQNMGIRRFIFRGLEKVSLEFGLYALSHNLKILISFVRNDPLILPV